MKEKIAQIIFLSVVLILWIMIEVAGWGPLRAMYEIGKTTGAKIMQGKNTELIEQKAAGEEFFLNTGGWKYSVAMKVNELMSLVDEPVLVCRNMCDKRYEARDGRQDIVVAVEFTNRTDVEQQVTLSPFAMRLVSEKGEHVIGHESGRPTSMCKNLHWLSTKIECSRRTHWRILLAPKETKKVMLNFPLSEEERKALLVTENDTLVLDQSLEVRIHEDHFSDYYAVLLNQIQDCRGRVEDDLSLCVRNTF